MGRGAGGRVEQVGRRRRGVGVAVGAGGEYMRVCGGALSPLQTPSSVAGVCDSVQVGLENSVPMGDVCETIAGEGGEVPDGGCKEEEGGRRERRRRRRHRARREEEAKSGRGEGSRGEEGQHSKEWIKNKASSYVD